jgi:DNA polymerase sigma
MVIDNETLNLKLKSYVSDVQKIIPVSKAYLFGSYAKGTPHEWSDVDVCFFSDFFGANSVENTVLLMKLAWKYNPDICFEPQGFSTAELGNDNPFIKEVLRTGQEIPLE